MATTTTTRCPACGKSTPIPKGYAGGPLTCADPACGQPIPAPTPASASTTSAPSLMLATPGPRAARSPGSRPELLDRVPVAFYASPIMLAVGAAGALLYGMVLFAAVSANRNRPESEPGPESEPAPRQVASAPEERVVVPAPDPAKGPSEPPKVKVAATKAAPTASKAAPPSEPARPSAPSATPAAPEKPALARADVSVPKTAVPPPAEPEPKRDRWGPLLAQAGDCPFRVSGDALTINLPGTLHMLSPELKTKNAPRFLTERKGDFVAQVQVAGKIQPGTDPLKDLPFTYQGAGLLVWQDEDNYLRFERSALFSPDHKRYHQVMVEVCRDGKALAPTFRDARDTDLTLKLERRGSEIRCQYTPDGGKTWLEVKRQNVSYPTAVRVGVSASNVSPKTYAARLEEFSLDEGNGKSPK